jgi:lactoylglutathione lyase
MTDATTANVDPHLWIWGWKDEKPRLLHTMLRVKDFDASLRFYVDGLGMRVFDRYEIESRRASCMFIGFNDYAGGGLIELAQYWDAEGPPTHGSGYGHVAIGAPDITGMLAKLEAMGVEVTLRPRALIGAGPRVAFVKDPDGYAVELIETRSDQAVGG